MTTTSALSIAQIQRLVVFGLVAAHPWLGLAFTSTIVKTNRIVSNHHDDNVEVASSPRRRAGTTRFFARRLRTNVEIPLLDLIDRSIRQKDETKDKGSSNSNSNGSSNGSGNDQASEFIVPLPSSDLPDQLATPFLYGTQMDTPLHKMILEEAISMAEATAVKSSAPISTVPRPYYGHLVWKDGNSLVGAIGCTAEILVNAPTQKMMGGGGIMGIGNAVEDELTKLEKAFSASEGDDGDQPKETDTNTNKNTNGNDNDNDNTKKENDDNVSPALNTVLCRGGWRFVVKEVVRSIPFPVAIVDEIQDDADEDDSDMFSTMGSGASDEEDDDDDDDDDDEFRHMPTPELIHNTMKNVQSIMTQKLKDATAKTQLGPLEKSILEAEGGGAEALQLASIELAHAEEMTAVWHVFQSSLVDDIEPSQRRFAVATMAAELADLPNSVRQEILLTRDSEERLRIVLRELTEIVGMERARKLASSITDKSDESQKDLKVGKPQLPPWAKQIRKGTKIEYFWNEEWGWCPGTVVEDPVTIVDELLVTVRFDEDGEKHKLPLSGEDKLRWRPAS